ncbi:unnamed protein product [Adineta steineri]|uniref:Uncharacterized protein n=2 Tax=Adineta steineri TaxID=433720 RepID=A0A819B638_9BILA|nr:unnamed protein product [Adineta steineri]
MGNYPKALSYYGKALEIAQHSRPSNHPDLARFYNNIGEVHAKMGNYLKALSYYEKNLEISKQSLPSNHPDLAYSYNNIGLVHEDIGNYSKAHTYYERAIQLGEQSLSSNHPNLQKLPAKITKKLTGFVRSPAVKCQELHRGIGSVQREYCFHESSEIQGNQSFPYRIVRPGKNNQQAIYTSETPQFINQIEELEYIFQNYVIQTNTVVVLRDNLRNIADQQQAELVSVIGIKLGEKIEDFAKYTCIYLVSYYKNNQIVIYDLTTPEFSKPIDELQFIFNNYVIVTDTIVMLRDNLRHLLGFNQSQDGQTLIASIDIKLAGIITLMNSFINFMKEKKTLNVFLDEPFDDLFFLN